MKTRMIVGLGATLVVGALAMSTVGGAFAQTRPTPVPDGMMSRGGATGAGGMMGGGGMFGFGPGSQSAPLQSMDAAKQAFQRYIDSTGNTDLALDEVMQFQWKLSVLADGQGHETLPYAEVRGRGSRVA